MWKYQSKHMAFLRKLSTNSVRCATVDRPGRKTHWSLELKKRTSCDRALEHFDDFYGSVFGANKWPSLRLALLSPTKYMAIPNTFTGNLESVTTKLETYGAYSVQKMWEIGKEDLLKEKKDINLQKDLGRIHKLEKTLKSIALTKKAEEMEVMYQNSPDKKRVMFSSGNLSTMPNSQRLPQEDLRMFGDPSEAAFMPPTKLKGVDDFSFDSDYYAGFLPAQDALDQDTDVVYTKPTDSKKLEFPKLLQPFTFEPGSALEFVGAAKDSSSGLREYLCINGASIAPVLALDLKPNVDLLDLCAGPGTKSLMALMTLSLKSITCNDLHQNRLHRVKKLFQEFMGSESMEFINFTKFNAMAYPPEAKFSRVLADVPCLADKTACTVADNNIFKTTRTKERLNLVKVQTSILLSALRSMSQEEGSATVYSTCTLSPVENDGVVMQAFRETDVSNLAVDLFGLLEILKPFERFNLFRLNRMRFGVLIEPNIFSNFGPMYISRIVVKKTTNVAETEDLESNISIKENHSTKNESSSHEQKL